MICQEFHDALLDYTKTSLERIRNENLFFCRKPFWSYNSSDNTAQLGFVDSIYFKDYDWVDQTKHNLCRMIINSKPVWKNKVDNLIGSQYVRTMKQASDLINSVTQKYIAMSQSISTNDELFESEYRMIEEYFESDRITYERITPLYGITLTNNFDLDNNTSLIILSKEQIETLLSIGIPLGWESTGHVARIATCAIRTRLEMPIVIGEQGVSLDQAQASLANPILSGLTDQQIIEVLRIYKAEPAYAVGHCFGSTNKIFSSGYSFAIGKAPQPWDYGRYQIGSNEIITIKKLWETRKNINISDKHFMIVALRRFSLSMNREIQEDRLIDLLICAEAIFLNDGDGSNELNFRLALRMAYFLGQDAQDRKEIYEVMQIAYKARSHVVHGVGKTKDEWKTKSGKKYSTEQICSETEGYIRETFNKLLNIALDSHAPKRLVEWDKLIFPEDKLT